MAHEINNPLAVINEKAGLMKDYMDRAGDFPTGSGSRRCSAAVFGGVQRCRGITHRILDFAGQPGESPDAVDLAALVREVVAELRQETGRKRVQVRVELPGNLPVVRSDRLQIRQVLASILHNAIDAVEDGGAVGVTAVRKNDGMLQVSIEDNGRGIPAENLKHIFEPFLLTSKETGKGMGLGLAISYGIMKRLGGGIFVSSEPDKGTVFTVELPVSPEGPGAAGRQ